MKRNWLKIITLVVSVACILGGLRWIGHSKFAQDEASLQISPKSLTIEGKSEKLREKPKAHIAGAPAKDERQSQKQVNSVDVKNQTALSEPEKPLDLSQKFVDSSKILNESWSAKDALGNRSRIAIIRNQTFKYPLLRMEEKWSGKSGELVSRNLSVADHVIIVPRRDADLPALKSKLENSGFQIRGQEKGSYILASFSDQVDELNQLPKKIKMLGDFVDVIEVSEPDYLVWICLAPNDPQYQSGNLWSLHNSGTKYGYKNDADIDANEAWDIRNAAPNVIVAITDTGIRYDHEDLVANVWTNSNEISGDGLDNDNNGVVDDIHGYNAVVDNGNPWDDQGHGTHCAGTIGARGNNQVGVVGVAWQCKLMACRFLGSSGGGSTSDAIKAINYARMHGAHVINASWGGGGYSAALRNAIDLCAVAGIPFVAAAGNSANNNDSVAHYPSSYNSPNIVSVAATNSYDQLTSFSCYGRESVDIAAPGWQILSTLHLGTQHYGYLSGTSMATPHISGALALAKAAYPADSANQLIDRLYQSADVLADLQGNVKTSARLNLASLLASTSAAYANDQFAQARIFSDNYAMWSGSNQGATRELNEDAWSGVEGARTLWFGWQAAQDSYVTLSCRSLNLGQRIAVFRGNQTNTLTMVADSGPSSSATATNRVEFFATQGENYRFVVAGDDSDQLFTITLTASGSNDTILEALPLLGNSFAANGNNRNATAESFEIQRSIGGVSIGKSVWFRWQPTQNMTIALSTEGSAMDTVLGLYVPNEENPRSWTELASNDDASSLVRWSNVTWSVQAGTTYYIGVDSALGSEIGDFQLRGSVPAPPTITTQPEGVNTLVGKRVVLAVSASGGIPLKYQWYKNGVAIPGAWQKSLTLDPLTSADFASYYVTVQNGYGSVQSSTAIVSERQSAPQVTWHSGDRSAVSGSNLKLSVRAVGTGVLTYHWSKNEQTIPNSNSPILEFSSVQSGDAGNYKCIVSNLLGSASASFQIKIVSSPWEGLLWTNDAVSNDAITDIKVIDGSCYAVSGNKLLVSTNGIDWNARSLPLGFYGSSIAKLGTLWICSGSDPMGDVGVISSSDGMTWSTMVSTTGVIPDDNDTAELFGLITFAGKFLGWNRSKRIHYSSDGINWTAASAVKLSDSLGNVSFVTATSKPMHDGTQILIPSQFSSNNYAGRYLRTTDGITWTEARIDAMPNGYLSGYNARTYFADSKWHFHTESNHLVSTDGITWQVDSAVLNANGAEPVSLGQKVFWHGVNERKFALGSPSALVELRTFNPNTAAKVTAATLFQQKLIYGTNSGKIGTATSIDDFFLPAEPIEEFDRVDFFNNEFIASASWQLKRSGDGIHWNRVNYLGLPQQKIIGYTGSRYFAETAGKGLLPESISEPYTTFSPDEMSTVGSSIIGLRKLNNLVKMSSDEGLSWTSVSGLQIGLNSKIQHEAGRWFLTESSSTPSGLANPYMLHSVNGLTWTDVTNVKARFVKANAGKWYAIGNKPTPVTTAIWESSNGSSWSPITTPVGLPGSFNIVKLLSYNNALVALIEKTQFAPRLVYFSDDGINWFPANMPRNIKDMAIGLGRLVAITSTGAIFTVGPDHPGNNAPVLEVKQPYSLSQQLPGSIVEIKGSCMEPDGGAVDIDFYLNGTFITKKPTAGEFQFRFRMGSASEYIAEIRATDSFGLVSRQAFRILPISSQLPNILSSADEGTGFLSPSKIHNMGGVTYAVSSNSLWRSLDGGVSWSSIPTPSSLNLGTSTAYITSSEVGNGALVLQLDAKTFASTRNGFNWETITMPYADINFQRLPLRFENGWFMAFSADSNGSSYGFFSQDGITWKAQPYSGSVLLGAGDSVSINEKGVIIIATSASPLLRRSTDFGANWVGVPLPGNNSLPYVWQVSGTFYASAGVRTWTSNDGLTWNEIAASSPISSPIVVQAGNRFFMRNSNSSTFSHVSHNALSWQSISGIQPQGKVVGSTLTGFISKHPNQSNTIISSADGALWKIVTNAPSTINSFFVHEDGFILFDLIGGVWKSPDGIVWTRLIPGRSANLFSLPTSTQPNLIRFSNRLLVGGNQGVLYYASADQSIWQKAKLGNSAIGSSSNVMQLLADNQNALAIINTQFNSNLTGIFQTSDGFNWTKPPQPVMSNQNIAYMAQNGSNLLAVGTNGLAWKSSDNGANWNSFTISGMVNAAAVAWYGNAWIVLATDSTTSETLKIFRSTNGTTWTKSTNSTFLSRNLFYPSKLHAAHGRLVCCNFGSIAQSADGLTWQSVTPPPIAVDVVPTSTGWLASTFGSSLTRVRMWTAPANMSQWTEIPPLQERVTGVENIGDTIYLHGANFLTEWTDRDYALDMNFTGSWTVGVGDNINLPITITNSGIGVSASFPVVESWISFDGFFGDGNDIYLGKKTLTTALPAASASVSLNAPFEIPSNVRPGSFYVVCRLTTESSVYEKNSSNNITISTLPLVTVPQRILTMNASGYGTLAVDSPREFYPHGARVSVMARPGKGARFAGWGGDAVGSLSEALIVMDSDKDVIANFSSSYLLVTQVRGAGTITMNHADGYFTPGDTATLQAQPLPGWQFSGWNGDLAGSASSSQLLMNSPKLVTAVFTQNYQAWSAQYFDAAALSNPLISGELADPDHDGLANWQEWLHVSNPNDHRSKGHSMPKRDNQWLVMSYTRRSDPPSGYSARSVASMNLHDWTLPVIERVIEVNQGVETIEARMDTSGRPRAFFSLQNTRP